MRIGIYPGSFDPLTNGHLDMLLASFRLVDRLVVAIGLNPQKAPLFTVEERLEMIEKVAAPLAKKAGVELVTKTFSNLVIDFAKECGAQLLIRGLRDGTDLDYEMQMAGMNLTLAPQIQTVFLPASPGERHITATLVRQVASMKGDVSPFVPQEVAQKIKQKF